MKIFKPGQQPGGKFAVVIATWLAGFLALAFVRDPAYPFEVAKSMMAQNQFLPYIQTNRRDRAMTKTEADTILDRYKHWNLQQKSVSLAFHGIRVPADDVYDAKRNLMTKAMNVLAEGTSQ